VPRTSSDRSAGRERYARLRALYRERPEEAVTEKWGRTSSANVAPDDRCHGEVEVGRGYGVSLRFGLDRHVGGLHDLPNPGDLLCAALASCADGSIRMIAGLVGVKLEELEVEVRGELDVRGTLGIAPEVPVGFRRLDCSVAVRAAPGSDPRSVERLLAAAERVCVNLDTLREPTTVTVRGGDSL
jgi:uncharacterized OsmC-like protein